MLRPLVFVWLVLLCNASPAQAPFFETYFGSSLPDYARSLKQMNDGSIFVAGYSNDTTTHHHLVKFYKLDPAGHLIWTKTFGDSLDNTGLFLQKTTDGNLLICGEKQTASNQLDAFLMKLDTAGNLIWQRNYGGPKNESVCQVAELADGRLAMTGFQTDIVNSNNIYVLYTDSAGNEIWSTSIGGSSNDVGRSLCALPDSGFVVFGETSRNAGDINLEGIRFNKNGIIAWDSTYSYNDTLPDGCQGSTLLSDGNILIYGESQASPVSWFDFLLHKIDINGNTIWYKKTGGPMPDAAFSVKEVPGGFIGTGYSTSYSSGPDNIIVFRCDTSGNILWAHPYGGPGIDIGYELIPALGGGFYIVATGNVNGDDQCGLLHVDDAGWTTVASEEDAAGTVAVFPNPASGTFFVTLPGNRFPSHIEIFSVTGLLVARGDCAPGTTLFTANTVLAPGMYFVRTQNGQSTFVSKLLVK